jgi:acyl-[acyl-carrier-protein]-phospholipid O-acyltransferase/long-chain-fatty-acid--[acyl-carrier-protein] ligase
MSKPQFDLFKTKRFWPLFTTQFLGAFNDNVFKTALVAIITFGIASSVPDAIAREFLVSEETAKFLVTLAPALFILPMFLFSALAGQLADKLEKSRLIRRVKMFEIIIMAIGAVGFFLKSIPLLMFVLFLMGLQSTFWAIEVRNYS